MYKHYPAVQQTFHHNEVWEPLYRMRVLADDCEAALFRSAPVRRLKHLHHFGAGALFCPVTHSRYEHTVGVWALVRHFFPEHRELRAAAIVHDVGHLPFSHTAEHVLNVSHHGMTEAAIMSPPISSILTEHELSPERIVRLLNEDSPLTHRSELLGLDHLDSFVRDTCAAGRCAAQPWELIGKLKFSGNYLDTKNQSPKSDVML
ncbi:HD domain protein [Paenibacillus konkukensis]|uniref:HD domain protein n=1 Tax=Paenibacillus konkukensis TaxID=2020716 RepID=A0ABY4RQ49_9BACL|nr:HD domain-containing protein [Paenibacillus konkukensis]UQZ83824.1 HD domain protein [Paenibacillus konkukensis]